MIGHWIDQCSKHHGGCQGNGEAWYPTRLLDLSEAQVVKLIISKDSSPKGSYITLSHRWSDQPFKKLTPSTISHLQHGIDVSRLPQVFQDAINIARHLRITYLWIDALCIVQDEPGCLDWKIESQTIDKIYSFAFLNVSATMSLDGSESLFQERSWKFLLPTEVKLEVNGEVQKRYMQNANIWDDEITEAPLNRRGWVFQERFLARRVLHFGQSQIGWECQELEALEMFPNGLPQVCATSSLNKSKVVSRMAKMKHQSDEASELDLVDLWQELVTAYSRCGLTFPHDKRVAISGVSRRMQEARTDRYAAGMWEKGMAHDLAWWRLSEDREAFPIDRTCSRAPSWSWTSVDGEIVFPSTFGGLRRQFINVLEMSEQFPDEGSNVQPRASLRIEGWCLPMSFERKKQEIIAFTVTDFRFVVNEAAEGATVTLEAEEEEVMLYAQQDRVFTLPLFATTYHLSGVIIIKDGKLGAYRRVGALEIPILAEVIQRYDSIAETNRTQVLIQANQQFTGELSDRSKILNRPAVKLCHHLLDPTRPQEIIDIC